jgi:hypothetical protein
MSTTLRLAKKNIFQCLHARQGDQLFTNLPNLLISTVPPELNGWWRTLDDSNDLDKPHRPLPLPRGSFKASRSQVKKNIFLETHDTTATRLDLLGDWIGSLTCVRLDIASS